MKSFSRNIFNSNNLKFKNSEVLIEATQKIEESKKLNELELLREEINKLEIHKQQVLREINKTKEEMERIQVQIIKKQEDSTSNLNDKLTSHREQLKSEKDNSIRDTQQKIDEMLGSAKEKEKEIIAHAKEEESRIFEESRKTGYDEGFSKGLNEGKVESERVENFLKKILKETIDKRDQIMEKFQLHLSEIVLTIVRKIVKKITDKDEKVVIENINACLQQIQGPVKLTLRVNISDFSRVEVFKSKLIESFSHLKQVDLIEDPTIEKGGCMVETDFAMIDGRISSQLDKIEKIINSTNLV